MGQCSPNQQSKCLQCGLSLSKKSSSELKELGLKHECSKKKSVSRNNFRDNKISPKLLELRKASKVDPNTKIKIKVPANKNSTLFKWIDEEVSSYPSKIALLPVEIISKGSFQEKLCWFRARIDRLKKQHCHGFELIQIDRENIIQSSMRALDGINLFKELRVSFKNDVAEDAGGGLLREWIHLCIKEIMSGELGIFKQANTDETAYQLIGSTTASDESEIQALNLLGLILSKAIIEKISVNCPLDRTIIRQLCSQEVTLSDVYSYDKAFYESWATILEMKNVEELYLDGTINHRFEDGHCEDIEVLPNGKNVQVNNENKEEYIAQLINLYCTKSVEIYLEQIFKTLTQFIPAELLSIFEPYEFEMLLSGPPEIDLQDWQNNTVYDGYDPDDKIIKWFWEIVQSYDQQGYKNLLHYCTGSTRVPILGFAKLETSHGHIKKFSIRKIDYNSENPFPKSYTCFNRLELPEYETKEELRERLAFTLEEEFNHFGLC